MANPQPNDAHLRIAHTISEQLMVSHFTEQQRRILDLILRLSWGCGKKEAVIPRQSDFELVGVRQGHVKLHLDWLENAKVIFRTGTIYSFNKDFDQWRVGRSLQYSPEKLSHLIRLNLNHNTPELTESVRTLRNMEDPSTPELTESVSQPLRNMEANPYVIRKRSEPVPDTPKETYINVKKRTPPYSPPSTSTLSTLEDYQKQLKAKFPDIDFDVEFEKFNLYWSEGTRKLQRPKSALLNWMTKARQFAQERKGGQSGTSQGCIESDETDMARRRRESVGKPLR